MLEGIAREQIGQLESRIEELAEARARCHKISVAARIAIGAGAALLAALLLGMILADGLSLMIAAILLLGGIVVYGSNSSTEKQIAASIGEAERMRAGLISQIELTLVPEPSKLLH
jgi:hypothetical protein